MIRAVWFAVLVALTLPNASCVIAIGKWRVSSIDDPGETKKPEKPAPVKKEKGTPITAEVQRQVANHEAAHAVAMAILFGIDEVTEVVVQTRETDTGQRGHVDWNNATLRFRSTLEVNRKRAVVYLVARSADTMINGAPVAGSSADLRYANEKITESYISWGLGGTPMTFESRADAPKWMRKRILEDLLDAEDYGDEIVVANRATIILLAKELMKLPEKDDKRRMSPVEFRAFCKLHKLVDPRAPAKKAGPPK